jgi:hypothetical protein
VEPLFLQQAVQHQTVQQEMDKKRKEIVLLLTILFSVIVIKYLTTGCVILCMDWYDG